jgi:hypothetical protein
MSVYRGSRLLRQALLADGVISSATGLLMLGGASFLARFLALPEALLQYAGLILLPYGLVVAYVATRERIRRGAVWAVVAINALWALDSIALLLSGWVAPNALGYAFVLFQAVVVAVFAELQYVGMRKSEPVAA